MQNYIYNLGLAFYQIASQKPDNIAIKFADKKYSFLELNFLSNQIARLLQNKNIVQNDIVAIFNTKSQHGFATMLACLKIGAIYVNIDFTSPKVRLKKMIETCQPSIFINDFDYQNEVFNEFDIPVINLQDIDTQNEIKKQANQNLEISKNITGNSPAYIMFTSGSTGFPKGAVMSHDNVLKLIQWGKQTYQVSDKDVFTNINPLYFDNSVFDFYVSLFNTASFAPFSYQTIKNHKAIVDYANLIKPTIWFCVPSMLVYLITTKSFKETDLQSLRVFTFGGEGFPKPKLKNLYKIFGHRVRFVNVYGPTECTCICSSYDISEKDFKNMTNLAPLGKIAANFKAIILSSEKDNEGELCLGGGHVGLGYYNDKERTEKSFILNPQNNSIKEIVYKTGDLVSIDDTGLIHFIGRVDNQIKHMGYRIELEEIEAAFNSLTYVNECGVIYKKMKIGGNILAFLSIKSDITIQEIQEDVKKILPPYMLPKSIKILNVLPKNNNGKIDRVTLKNS